MPSPTTHRLRTTRNLRSLQDNRRRHPFRSPASPVVSLVDNPAGRDNPAAARAGCVP